MSSVNVIGFKEFAQKLKTMPVRVQKWADVEVQEAGLMWANLAKRSAPVDKGFLRGGINSGKKGEMISEVTSEKLYSPYVEWGTGTKVKVPTELQSYAIQFKGIKEVVGRYPAPFFFIHKEAVRKKLIEQLKIVLSEGN